MSQTYKKMTYINLRVAMTLGAVLFSANVQALIVLQQFSVPIGLDFDTNPTLSPTDKKSIMRFTASPRYSVAAVDEKNRWYSNVGLSIVRTTDKKITDDRQDPNINVGWTRELEKGSFSLTGAYNKSSSRFRELRTSGFVDGDGSSVTKSIAANWTSAITERLDYLAGVN